MKQSLLSLFNASLAMVLLVASCVRDVVLDAGEKPQIVVDCSCIPEHRYRLEVQVPGHDLIYAEDTMPEAPSVFCRSWEPTLSGSYMPGGTGNNGIKKDYLHRLWGTYFTIESLPDNVIVYALNYNPETREHEIAEKICTDFNQVHTFNLTGRKYVPEGLDGEEGGLLYPMLENANVHKRFLMITDDADISGDNKYMILSGSFTGDYYGSYGVEPKYDEGYIVFDSLSEHYSKYLRESIYFQQLQESTDLKDIYQRENIYSNISGGVGIFAAHIEQKCQLHRRYTPIEELSDI